MKNDDFEMKDEYDFTNAVRGKFYNPNAVHSPPIWLDTDILIALEPLRKSEGLTLADLVNKILRKDIEYTQMFSVKTKTPLLEEI